MRIKKITASIITQETTAGDLCCEVQRKMLLGNQQKLHYLQNIYKIYNVEKTL